MLYPLPIRYRSFALVALLFLVGCGPREVRNDDYEKPNEPDYALRQLLGVQTLSSSFEIPKGMKAFRLGLLYIENGQVTASDWMHGDGLHTMHANGVQEYAKTILAEHLVWKNNGKWEEVLRITPSFVNRGPSNHQSFWEAFRSESLMTQGYTTLPNLGRFGDFRVLAASYGAKDSVASGYIDSLLRDMDFLVLLVVDFLPEDPNSEDRPIEFPSDDELQVVVGQVAGGMR